VGSYCPRIFREAVCGSVELDGLDDFDVRLVIHWVGDIGKPETGCLRSFHIIELRRSREKVLICKESTLQ